MFSSGGGFLPPVVLEIIANLDKLKTGIDQAGAELNKLEGMGQSTGKRFGTALRVGVMAAGTAIAGFAAIAVKEAMQAETVMADLQNNIKMMGQSAEEVIPQVQAMGDAMVELGFDDEDATAAFVKLNTALGDSKSALELSGLAADLARKKHVSLEDAARMLAMASTGSARAFKEFGISMDTSIKDPVARANKAFFELQESIDGTAEAFGQTAAGQMAAFKEQTNNVMQELGTALLPALKTVVGVLQVFAKWAKQNADVLKNVLLGAIALVTGGLIGMAVAAVAASWQIYLGVAIVAALAAAFIYAYNNSEQFRNAVIQLGKVWVNVLGVSLQGWVIFFASVTTGLNVILGALAAVAKATGQTGIGEALDAAGDSLRGASGKLLGFNRTLEETRGKINKMADDGTFSKLRFSFDIDDFTEGLKNKFTGLTTLGTAATEDAAKKSAAKGVDKFIESIGMYRDRFRLLKEQVAGNIPAMKQLAAAAQAEAAKFLQKANAYEKATRNTDRHAAAVKRLAAAMKLATETQRYSNDVTKAAAKEAETAARALDQMSNSYARNDSYMAARNRVSGVDQRNTYIEVPVSIDGQVLFRVNQKASLQNNRRNSTNGLTRSGSVI